VNSLDKVIASKNILDLLFCGQAVYYVVGLDHRAGRLRGFLLRRRVLVSSARPDERHQSRHRADAGSSHEAAVRAAAVLRSDQTVRHLRALLRRQLQRHTQEVPQHGGAGVRLPLTDL